MKRLLVVLLALFACSSAAEAFWHGVIAVVSAPVVNVVSPVASSSATGLAKNGQAIATLTATQSPTSWAISSCSGCTSYFAIDNSGNLTVTSTGASSITMTGTGTTYTPVVTASNGIGTSSGASIPVKFYPDGALDATVCTPTTAYCYQQSNFFTGYTGTTYAARPAWKVSGVDYPVGISDACITAGLKDPSTSAPSGTSYSGNVLTVTGTSVSMDCYDFSLHNGISILLEAASGTFSVTNSYFLYGSAQSGNASGLAISSYSCGSTAITFNHNVAQSTHGGIAGGSVEFTGFTLTSCTGAMVAEYNYMKDSTKDFIDYDGTTNLLLQFNYGQGMGESTGAHSQPYLRYASGSSNGDIEAFNVFYADTVSTGSSAMCEYNNSPVGTQNNVTCNNNVLVVTSSSGSYLVEPNAGTTGTFTASSNYFDSAAIFGSWYGNPESLTTVSTGNINMIDGASCNAYSNSC